MKNVLKVALILGAAYYIVCNLIAVIVLGLEKEQRRHLGYNGYTPVEQIGNRLEYLRRIHR